MKFLIDSDYLVALTIKADTNHRKAQSIDMSFASDDELFVLSLVIQETATVLSHKAGQKLAKEFIKRLPQQAVTKLPFDEKIEEASWDVFLRQTKKGTSFVDCANLAAVDYYKMDKIASFDRFYPKEFLLG